jgi:hypothetical protein
LLGRLSPHDWLRTEPPRPDQGPDESWGALALQRPRKVQAFFGRRSLLLGLIVAGQLRDRSVALAVNVFVEDDLGIQLEELSQTVKTSAFSGVTCKSVGAA